MKNIAKYVAEFIGTFFLIIIGTGAIIINNTYPNALGHLGISIAFGAVILVMIYTCGHVSGAHFNPAVTIAFSVWGKFDKKHIIPYIVSQILGAICGSLLLRSLFGNVYNLGATLPNYPAGHGSSTTAFVFEVIFTFCLMFVIMSVATDSKAEGSFAGIVIGLTVMMGAAVAGPISGGSFNPARSIGPALVSGNLNHIWIYILAPIVGAVLASGLYTFMRKSPNNTSKQMTVSN
jgi:aquaporin Z